MPDERMKCSSCGEVRWLWWSYSRCCLLATAAATTYRKMEKPRMLSWQHWFCRSNITVAQLFFFEDNSQTPSFKKVQCPESVQNNLITATNDNVLGFNQQISSKLLSIPHKSTTLTTNIPTVTAQFSRRFVQCPWRIPGNEGMNEKNFTKWFSNRVQN